MRPRERLILQIPQGFPLDYPGVDAAHKRFADSAHVQWGSHLCIYRAPDIEWVPSDGMYGFIERLNDWLKAGALNQLDPDGEPLHPPVAYPTSQVRIISRANAPVIEAGSAHWVGAAHLIRHHDKRFDLTGWSQLSDPFPDLGERNICAAAVLLNTPMPMEYPDTVFKLVMSLHERGMPISILLKLLRLYTIRLAEGEALYMVLGAPQRRRDVGGALKQHLTVWRIEPDAAQHLRASLAETEEGEVAERAFIKWAASAYTEWCRVHEDREEVTIRRDTGASAEWLRGKRLLLLGCGALGSFIGEYLVRAGAATLDLVDKDVVTPGILVRQLHNDDYIAYSKSHSLKKRLESIKFPTVIRPHTNNLRYGVFKHFDPDAFDLMIDATASPTVACILEEELKTLDQAPPIASASVSKEAKYGMAIVRMSGFSGGTIDVSRRAKLAALASSEAVHFAAAFWPKREDISLFQPEPGCSDPTFIGSAIDMAYHSSALMSLILERVNHLGHSGASADFIAKPSIERGDAKQAYEGFEFSNVLRERERRFTHDVYLAPGAIGTIEAEIRKNTRIRGARVETGGLMFGDIDDSLKTVWLDSATGPPPDSVASERQFLCGVEGTQEISEARKTASGGSSHFIGIWHTHPVSMPEPSDDDLIAMAELLLNQEKPPRHVLMLIIGFAATAPRRAFYIYRRNEFTRVIEAYAALERGDNGSNA